MQTFTGRQAILFDADGDYDLDYLVPNFGGIVDPSNLQDHFQINQL